MSNGKTMPMASADFNKSNGVDAKTYNLEPSLTRQEFAEECDINSLMKRYEGHVTGGPGNLAPLGPPVYIDFNEIPDNLMDYMHRLDDATAAFNSLPANVRREFDNSPYLFVDFASDPLNLEQMRFWGLAPPAKAPETPPAVAPAPSAEAPPKPS
ncbi:internal scaffolding protein [robinz microvirus RP_117]|nr:internal scaffolding protein [robinz microvirus RP_117]